VLNWATAYLLVVLLWNASLEVPGSPNHAIFTARLTVPLTGMLVHLWLIAPAMASWEATGVRRVRVLSAFWVAVGILLTIAAVEFQIRYVTEAPPAMVPGYFIGIDDILGARWPLLENMLVLAGLAGIFVCLLGRPLGTCAALLTYVTFVVGGANTSWYQLFPYFSHAFGIPVSHHPIPATVLPILAVTLWIRKGGTAPLARKLDPRT
jgi:hypothetical protein